MNNCLKASFIALIVVGGFTIAGNASALTLIPPSHETAVDPGVTYTTQIKLYNETQEAIELYAEAVSFTADGETGNPSYDFDAPRVGASTWFELPTEAIVLDVGERKVIDVSITPPENADPGGHYVGVFFGTEPPEVEGGATVAIGAKIGSLFLLRVFGDITETGEIVEFDTDQASYARLPVNFFTRFSNTGNIHIRPKGTITVTNLFGRTSAELEVNPKDGATLPGTIRKYENIWEKAQVEEANGNFWSNFWTEFGNEWRNFGFGRYKATVDLVAGSGGLIQETSTMTFWVLPWRIISVAGIALVVFIFILVLLVKQYNSWILKKANKQ